MYNNAPQELIGIGVASVGGWLIFEYLNFFVLEYWYYPFGGLIPDAEWYTYALFASSGLMPLSFQWLSYFNTFPNFVNKYKFGPKISIGRTGNIILLIAAFVALFCMPMVPTCGCQRVTEQSFRNRGKCSIPIRRAEEEESTQWAASLPRAAVCGRHSFEPTCANDRRTALWRHVDDLGRAAKTIVWTKTVPGRAGVFAGR